ncbi:hypothetical protein Tco_0128389 [Tanacetum coccineum]
MKMVSWGYAQGDSPEVEAYNWNGNDGLQSDCQRVYELSQSENKAIAQSKLLLVILVAEFNQLMTMLTLSHPMKQRLSVSAFILIIFDDPYVENNGGTFEHDSNAHDEYHNIQMLAYNVQREAENKKRLNNELKRQKELLQKELETFKD